MIYFETLLLTLSYYITDNLFINNKKNKAMHKGIIILTQAEHRDEALTNVEVFLDMYKDQVWDWYAIGNRWHNALAPKDKLKEFNEWVRKEFSDAFIEEHGGYQPQKLETPENREKNSK